MVLCSAFKIGKTFGVQTLFDGLTLAIETGQRIGLIGPNGAGKSTLLQILAGTLSADSGQLSRAKNLRLGYMSQSPEFAEGDTVFTAIAHAIEDPYEPHHLGRISELISRLGLDGEEAGSERPIDELSGGWRKRVALARELVKQPDLLLLDEPTNHLDIDSIAWLEGYLDGQTSMAMVIITHDRLFLQNTCDWIYDLDRRNPDGLIKYEGSYSDFLEFKEAGLSAQKQLEQSRKNVLRRETEWLRRGAKARQTKQKSRIERAEQLAEQVGELAARNQERVVQLDFGDAGRSPKKLIEAKSISKKIGDRYLFKDLSLLIGPRSRVGLLGPNGCGKSTLIRHLLGQQKPDSGEVFVSDDVRVAYFEQQKQTLDPESTLLRTVCPAGDYVEFQGQHVFARSYLSRFHFRSDQMDLPVGKLSGGEQSRILIAKLMLQSANVLVLDEPTNDLDVGTLEVLEQALVDFRGAILLVTHDRYFLDQVSNQILAFSEDGEILKFADYFQWQEWKKNGPPPSKESSANLASEGNAAKAKKTRLSYKEQRELDQMESVISKAEQQLTALEEQVAPAGQDYKKLAEINASIEKQRAQIDLLYSRWSELSNKASS